MSTQQFTLPFTSQKVLQQRENKAALVEKFFWERIGKEFSSYEMHGTFGSAFRSRVSDVNKDETSRVTIRNKINPQASGAEHSVYYAERRGVTPYLARYVESGE